MSNLTLGSLFDGSGGFPLAGMLNGITPIWASEVEPFPIRVTTKRIPQMKHLGDIIKIDGSKIEPVDIITFGSPCQNLSLAGKRSGLDGEKSSLFYEAIRIIKEMRNATNGKYPRFIVWENVPGAYSSAGGNDFRCVLEEIIKIKDETYTVPMPERPNGSIKWMHSGEIVADNFSIAWRTIDAQFWGVPQRRRRIYLITDFASECAGKILFESEGMSRYPKESRGPRQGTSENATDCTGKAISVELGAASRLGKKCEIEKTGTLRAQMGDNQTAVVYAITTGAFTQINKDKVATLAARDYKDPQCVFENHGQDSRYIGPLEVAQTVSATFGMGGNNQPFVVSDIPKAYGICSDGSNSMKSKNSQSGIYEADTSRTLDGNACNPSAHQGGIAIVEEAKAYSFDPYNNKQDDVMPSIGTNCGMSTGRSICLQGSMIGRKNENGPNGDGINEEVSFTLDATDRHAVVYAVDQGGGKSSCNIIEDKSPTLTCTHCGEPAIYAIDRETFNCGQNFARNLGISEDGIASTLNAQGPSAVAEPISFYPQMKAESQSPREGIANTIVNGTNPGFQNGIVEPTYTVRRLTPLECAKLQGFPDFWCSNLGIKNPTDEDISFWTEVFETHRLITGTSSKPKSKMQIIKWLKDPHSDSAEYRMWGNGVALPCVRFILGSIANFMHNK